MMDQPQYDSPKKSKAIRFATGVHPRCPSVLMRDGDFDVSAKTGHP